MIIVIVQPMYDVQILSIGIAQLWVRSNSGLHARRCPCAVSTDIAFAFATVPTRHFEDLSGRNLSINLFRICRPRCSGEHMDTFDDLRPQLKHVNRYSEVTNREQTKGCYNLEGVTDLVRKNSNRTQSNSRQAIVDVFKYTA